MARYRNVDGVETVERVFRGLPRRAAEGIARALNQGADEIAALAAVMVPVDTGDLKATIGVRRTDLRATADSRRVAVYVVAGDTRETANAAFRSEFGRAPGGSGVRNADHPGHAAQPFLFPAYWALRKRARGRVARAIAAAARAARAGR